MVGEKNEEGDKGIKKERKKWGRDRGREGSGREYFLTLFFLWVVSFHYVKGIFFIMGAFSVLAPFSTTISEGVHA